MSLIKTCRFLIRRTIVPLNEEEFGIDRASLNISENEEVVYQHLMCEEVAVDLDHIVLKCNKYKPCEGRGLLNPDVFK